MKKRIFLVCFLICFSLFVYGQVDCEDYAIVSIYDIPPTPLTPGGNYFLLLLTLEEDHENNIDNYANLFFVDHIGDTISIPTGPNSTLPQYASDTIPYILKLNSSMSNQDFPNPFFGQLIITHATQLQCEIEYSNIISNTKTTNEILNASIYPNPFTDSIKLKSSKQIERVLIFNSDGKIIDKPFNSTEDYHIHFKNLRNGTYYTVIQFKGGVTEIHTMIKT